MMIKWNYDGRYRIWFDWPLEEVSFIKTEPQKETSEEANAVECRLIPKNNQRCNQSQRRNGWNNIVDYKASLRGWEFTGVMYLIIADQIFSINSYIWLIFNSFQSNYLDRNIFLL